MEERGSAKAEESEAVREGAGKAEERNGEESNEMVESLPAVPETGAIEAPPGERHEGSDEIEGLPEEGTEDVLELLTFTIAGKEFAFRIADVEEIIPYQGITCVPLLPDYVSGIMSLRGKIVPVIDLRARFSLGQSPSRSSSSAPESKGRKAKILVLEGPKGLIGAIVDRIIGVVRFPEDSLLAPPAHLTEEERRFIEGVVVQEKRFISVVRFQDTVDVEVG